MYESLYGNKYALKYTEDRLEIAALLWHKSTLPNRVIERWVGIPKRSLYNNLGKRQAPVDRSKYSLDEIGARRKLWMTPGIPRDEVCRMLGTHQSDLYRKFGPRLKDRHQPGLARVSLIED